MGRIKFDPTITFGSVLTIISGLFVAASLIASVATAYSSIKGELASVKHQLAQLECSLTASGIISTTLPCTLPARRRAELP